MRKPTAGEMSLKALADPAKYESMDVGNELTKDVLNNIVYCIDKHKDIIQEPEFCVVMLLADDPIIKNMLRIKYYAWPYLPKPRPRQSCFLYRRTGDTLLRLWTLPHAGMMEGLTLQTNVEPEYKQMQEWSKAFYNENFFDYIRKQHGIGLLSESEYLKANREELVKSCTYDVPFLPSDAVEITNVAIDQIENKGNFVST